MAVYEVGFAVSQYWSVQVEANTPDEARSKAVMFGPSTIRTVGTLNGEHVDEVEVNEDELTQ